MKWRVVVGLLAFLLLATCAFPGARPSCNAQIDWVNFVEVGSTQYVAGLQSANTYYRVKDGDAAFLDPGTPIYQINGQLPSQDLAARFNGQIVDYKAMTATS